MSTIYFIRHGQASFGKADYDELSPQGHDQARRLAEHLGGEAPFDLIVTGTLKRQRDTAQALTRLYSARRVPTPELEMSDAFNEYDSESVCRALIPEIIAEDPSFEPKVAEMLTDNRSFQRVFATIMLRWVAGDYQDHSVVRWETFKAGVNAAIDHLLENHGRGKRIAVFTSGGPIAVTVQKAIGLSDPITMQLNWQLANASVTRFKCTNKKIMLATFNEYAYLEHNATRLVTFR